MTDIRTDICIYRVASLLKTWQYISKYLPLTISEDGPTFSPLSTLSDFSKPLILVDFESLSLGSGTLEAASDVSLLELSSLLEVSLFSGLGSEEFSPGLVSV